MDAKYLSLSFYEFAWMGAELKWHSSDILTAGMEYNDLMGVSIAWLALRGVADVAWVAWRGVVCVVWRGWHSPEGPCRGRMAWPATRPYTPTPLEWTGD